MHRTLLFERARNNSYWIRRFNDLNELRTALVEFRNRYNESWIIERLNYRTPLQARRDFQVDLQIAA